MASCLGSLSLSSPSYTDHVVNNHGLSQEMTVNKTYVWKNSPRAGHIAEAHQMPALHLLPDHSMATGILSFAWAGRAPGLQAHFWCWYPSQWLVDLIPGWHKNLRKGWIKYRMWDYLSKQWCWENVRISKHINFNGNYGIVTLRKIFLMIWVNERMTLILFF